LRVGENLGRQEGVVNEGHERVPFADGTSADGGAADALRSRDALVSHARQTRASMAAVMVGMGMPRSQGELGRHLPVPF